MRTFIDFTPPPRACIDGCAWLAIVKISSWCSNNHALTAALSVTSSNTTCPTNCRSCRGAVNPPDLLTRCAPLLAAAMTDGSSITMGTTYERLFTVMFKATPSGKE